MFSITTSTPRPCVRSITSLGILSGGALTVASAPSPVARLELLYTTRRDQNARPGGFGDLKRRQRDTSTDTEDKDGFAALQLCLREQHAPSGEIVDAERGGLREIEIIRGKYPVICWKQHELGHGSVAMLSQQAHLSAEHRFATFAEFAATADDAGIMVTRRPINAAESASSITPAPSTPMICGS